VAKSVQSGLFEKQTFFGHSTLGIPPTVIHSLSHMQNDRLLLFMQDEGVIWRADFPKVAHEMDIHQEPYRLTLCDDPGCGVRRTLLGHPIEIHFLLMLTLISCVC
jgi:hypothetical protein